MSARPPPLALQRPIECPSGLHVPRLAPEPNRSSNNPLEHWDGFLWQAAVTRLAAGAVSAAARAPNRQWPFDPRSAVPICSATVNKIQITVSSGGFAENPLLFAKMNPRSTPVEK